MYHNVYKGASTCVLCASVSLPLDALHGGLFSLSVQFGPVDRKLKENDGGKRLTNRRKCLSGLPKQDCVVVVATRGKKNAGKNAFLFDRQ